MVFNTPESAGEALRDQAGRMSRWDYEQKCSQEKRREENVSFNVKQTVKRLTKSEGET
jgi:hypothetical protein